MLDKISNKHGETHAQTHTCHMLPAILRRYSGVAKLHGDYETTWDAVCNSPGSQEGRQAGRHLTQLRSVSLSVSSACLLPRDSHINTFSCELHGVPGQPHCLIEWLTEWLTESNWTRTKPNRRQLSRAELSWVPCRMFDSAWQDTFASGVYWRVGCYEDAKLEWGLLMLMLCFFDYIKV